MITRYGKEVQIEEVIKLIELIHSLPESPALRHQILFGGAPVRFLTEGYELNGKPLDIVALSRDIK